MYGVHMYGGYIKPDVHSSMYTSVLPKRGGVSVCVYFVFMYVPYLSVQMPRRIDAQTYRCPGIYFLWMILNQAHTSLWPARAWFLKIASVQECLYVYVCVSTPEAMNSY